MSLKDIIMKIEKLSLLGRHHVSIIARLPCLSGVYGSQFFYKKKTNT